MKVEKRDIQVFIALWIKNDPELWAELKEVEINLIIDRFIKERSFKEIAQEQELSEKTIRLIFKNVIIKIDRFVSREVARCLQLLNAQIEARPDNPFPVFEIFLN